jgi:single-stranded-DNA-specific exonuclease
MIASLSRKTEPGLQVYFNLSLIFFGWRIIVEYSWTLSQFPDEKTVNEISKNLGISISIAKILTQRGFDTPEKVKAFFKPAIGQLHDPFIMDGMDIAIDRLLLAIEKKENILVFGDYDVDGTNSLALFYLFFREIGTLTRYFVPDRLKEGYGLTNAFIDRFKSEGISLIVTVDCGTTSIEPIRYAKSLGIDTIVCDHHTPGDSLPDAVAILNPLKKGCNYPFKYLCGCGVAFKLIDGIAKRIKKPTLSLPYLQFVAIATMADIVPLVDENRVMVHYGLELLNEVPRAGIQALIEVAGLSSKKMNSSQIVFILAPRINAVGRLGDATRAVELMICDNLMKAIELAKVLEEENKTRSKIDRDIFLEAQELVKKILEVEPDIPIILHEAEWHPGVIGIVASRLAEKYCRPAIMMTTIDGVAKGSARSVEGFDIYEVLKKCEDKILQFGGHKYAAGLAVEIDRLDEFREAFNEIAKKILSNRELKPQIIIDSQIDFSEITLKFRDTLQNFAPYGPQNMRPLFLTKRVEIIGLHRFSTGDKFKLRLRQDSVIFEAVCFNLSDKLTEIEKETHFVDIVFSIEESDRAGYDKLPIQLKIRDIKANKDIN